MKYLVSLILVFLFTISNCSFLKRSDSSSSEGDIRLDKDDDDDDDDDDEDDNAKNFDGGDEGNEDKNEDYDDDKDNESGSDGFEGDSFDEKDKEFKWPSFGNTGSGLIPVKKIKTEPYRRGNYLVNAVYLVRDNETIKDISDKIYQTNRIEVLYTINPHFRSKKVKVGDKIYYPSPVRKNDSSRLLTYYEDINRSPSYYQIKAGESIRVIAKQLLGHKDSWKEIWATNLDLDSKTTMKTSFNLKYWNNNESEKRVSAPDQLIPTPEEPSELEPMQEEVEPSLVVEEETTETTEPIKQEEEIKQKPQEIEEEEPDLEEYTDAEEKNDDFMEESFKKGFPKDLKGWKDLLLKKEIWAILIGIVLIIIIIIRIILKKREEDQEFDYTTQI